MLELFFNFSIDLDLESEFSYPGIEVHHDVQMFMNEPLPLTAVGKT